MFPFHRQFYSKTPSKSILGFDFCGFDDKTTFPAFWLEAKVTISFHGLRLYDYGDDDDDNDDDDDDDDDDDSDGPSDKSQNGYLSPLYTAQVERRHKMLEIQCNFCSACSKRCANFPKLLNFHKITIIY